MPLEVALVALLIVVAAVSRPVEVRLWQAGRLSDRAYVALFLSRFPLLVGMALVILGAPLAVLVALPGLLLYRFVLRMVREQRDAQST